LSLSSFWGGFFVGLALSLSNKPTCMKKLILFVFLFFSLSVSAQVCPLSDFIETPIPQSNSAEWHKLNFEASQRFGVSIVNGKVQVSKVESSITDTTSYNFKSGQLFAYNGGEFGGELYFLPKDTTQVLYANYIRAPLVRNVFTIGIRKELVNKLTYTPHMLVTTGNINAIFSYRDSLFFMEGLAHMGFNRGAIYKLDFEKNNFTTTKMLDFDDAPTSIAIYMDKLFVATHKRLYVVDKWQKELILSDLFWYGFYPNSIAVYDSNIIYVGMNGGYVKVDIKKKQLTFYKYKLY
jgi:hypothetical protein